MARSLRGTLYCDAVFVRESGRGEPVLLLHGTPSPADDWQPLVERLSSRYRVLVPDLPGYGNSEQLPDSSMESVGDAIAAMLSSRGVRRLRAVVGYSTGAYRAFDLVTRAGISAELIVSLAGMATFDAPAREMRRQLARSFAADPHFIDSPDLRALMPELMLAPAWRASHPADVVRVTEWLSLSSSKALAAELDALARSRDLLPELTTLASRVYARVGALDQGCPPAWSESIVAHAPLASLDVVEGCGHALLIEDVDATTRAIAAEIDRGGR